MGGGGVDPSFQRKPVSSEENHLTYKIKITGNLKLDKERFNSKMESFALQPI